MLRSLFQSKASAAKAQALGNVRQAAGKKYFKYVLVFGLLFALSAGISYFEPDDVLMYYLWVQVFALLLGIIHVWQMGKRFEWRNQYSFYEKLEMTLMILLVSYLLMGVVFWFLPLKSFTFIFPTSAFIFILPLLTMSTFDYMMAIPDEEYKLWYYPEKMEIPDMDKIDFANSYVLTFEVYKKDNERLPTIMKFKAPLANISFGDLFFMYLYEYNEANRENPIEYWDSKQKRYPWLFYVKPKRWWNSKIMVDPSLTVRENKIKENCTIVPYRV